VDFSRLTDFLDSLPQKGIPGVDLILQKDYETLYRHQSGYADREKQLPMTGKERFFLYSATKPITCAAALRLYEKGRFLLTDPLYEYIPEFRHMQVRNVLPNGIAELREAKQPITISQLFSMTSGFDYDWQLPEIQQVLKEKGEEASTLEVVRSMAKKALLFEPGTHWHYGLSHDILGALIEIVSGKRFGEFLKEEIFQPLGMEKTEFAKLSHLPDGMMAQYRYNYETKETHRIGLENVYCFSGKYESGGAGLISTVEDYARFAAAMANGGRAENGYRLLSGHTIDLMRTNHLSPRQIEDFDWPQMQGYGYGLGVRTVVDPARGGISSPVGEFGWGGAAGCYVMLDPKNHISLFYTQHMLNNLEEYVHPRIRNIVYGCL